MDPKPVIEFDHVSKSYQLGYRPRGIRETLSSAFAGLIGRSEIEIARTVKALDDVSFQLEKGRALGIIGPNGAGKTTILKLLSRISYPSRGSVVARGKAAALIELGAGFHPDLTGRENLFLNASILGMPQREVRSRYDEIVAFAELERFMDTPVKRYSSGMYVRLAFAVAAHVEPQILLVDEVLVVGDARFQQKCIARITELKESGVTILFVSHNMNLMRSVCDEGIFLNQGRIAERGDIAEVVRAYDKFNRQAELRGVASLNLSHVGFETQDTGVKILAVYRSDDGDGSLASDQPLSLDVRIHSGFQLRQPHLLTRIIRSDGTTCCEFRSSHSEEPLRDIEGESRLRVCFDPIQLATGLYLVEVRIHDSTDTVVLATGQSDWFHVRGPGLTSNYPFTGVFVPRVRLTELRNP